MGLKAFFEAGTVVPSVILRKLAAAGAGNALSRALRALGRNERTLFTLRWLSEPALRQRSHAGLNKGAASNVLRRAVLFHRLGKIRDRTFENQSFPSGWQTADFPCPQAACPREWPQSRNVGGTRGARGLSL